MFLCTIFIWHDKFKLKSLIVISYLDNLLIANFFKSTELIVLSVF